MGYVQGGQRAFFEIARINADGQARALSGILQAICEDTTSGASLLGLPAFRQTIEKIVVNAVRALPRKISATRLLGNNESGSVFHQTSRRIYACSFNGLHLC